MGIRVGHLTAVATLLAVTACAHSDAESAPHSRTMIVSPSPTAPSPSSLAAAPELLTRLLSGFVEATCVYDSTREGPRSFLVRAASLTTAAELHRLVSSPRAALDWPALRNRRERTSVQFSGITVVEDTGTRQTDVVEAIRTTHTDFADVRDFVSLRVELVQTPAGWRVDAASGAGL